MKNTILSVSVALAVLASSAFGAGQKATCRITGKTMDQCCCEMKNGKFYCKLTKKSYDECCCDMK
jgi:predicted regulator of Ras-like GTPase activity (Roadblock/LC7/MglB family)